MKKRDITLQQYRPATPEQTKQYIVKHSEYGEARVSGRNKYEAVTAAARKWGARWTSIARECEFTVLEGDKTEGGTI